MLARFDNGRLIGLIARRDQSGDSCSGVVNRESAIVDTAIFFLICEQPIKAFFHVSGALAWLEIGITNGGSQRQRRERRELGIIPVTFSFLLRGQPCIATGDGLLHFLLQGDVGRNISQCDSGGCDQTKYCFHSSWIWFEMELEFCGFNQEKYRGALWWDTLGVSQPHLIIGIIFSGIEK